MKSNTLLVNSFVQLEARRLQVLPSIPIGRGLVLPLCSRVQLLLKLFFRVLHHCYSVVRSSSLEINCPRLNNASAFDELSSIDFLKASSASESFVQGK